MKSKDVKNWAVGLGVLAVIIAAVRGYKFARATAEDVAEGVNPVSDKNFAYRGVNAVGEVLTGDDSFTLGGWIYRKLNPQPDQSGAKSSDEHVINSNLQESIAG